MTDQQHISIDPSHFRAVLAHLPTGVAAITAWTDDGPVGMAANSVASVSLDPPLVLFCPAKSSSTWPQIRATSRFCINVMAAHHEDVTLRFAMRDVDRFAAIAHDHRAAGPAVSDAAAWIECQIQDEHDAGDHTIVVAKVTALEAAADAVDPLVFFRGGYGSFAAPERD